MNWSEYSFVGGVFGAPRWPWRPGGLLLRIHLHRVVDLRLEQAAPAGASGLHLDRRNRGQRVAFFIIAANSFMQHPVSAHYSDHRACRG